METCFDFYKFIGFLLAQLLHLFFLTMQGQFVINSSDEIYNRMWVMIVMEIFFSSGIYQRLAWVKNDAKNWKIIIIYF